MLETLIKKIEFLILHFVVVFVRRGFHFLLRRCGVNVGDHSVFHWYNERCGLEECIFDDYIMNCLMDLEFLDFKQKALEDLEVNPLEKSYVANP